MCGISDANRPKAERPGKLGKVRALEIDTDFPPIEHGILKVTQDTVATVIEQDRREREAFLACGGGVNCTDSEMGHLYYTELGNAPFGPLTNTGPFSNMQADGLFWLSTDFLNDPPGQDDAWSFDFHTGSQGVSIKTSGIGLILRSRFLYRPSALIVSSCVGYSTSQT